MKKLNHPVLLMLSILIALSVACSALGGGGAPAPNPTVPPVPTNLPPVNPPTEAPTKAALPTSEPVVTNPEFFTEEFENDQFFNNWYYFLMGSGSSEEDKLTMTQEDDGLTVDLGALNMYLYYIYDPTTYDDVKITMVAENLGRNNNNVSMVCRMDYDNAKWYEFSVESGGVWYLYAYDNGYNTLDRGGTNALKQGKAVNEYGLECDGDSITMYINGEKLKTFSERKYSLREGEVGFNISSLNVLPITVSVKSFDIAQP